MGAFRSGKHRAEGQMRGFPPPSDWCKMPCDGLPRCQLAGLGGVTAQKLWLQRQRIYGLPSLGSDQGSRLRASVRVIWEQVDGHDSLGGSRTVRCHRQEGSAEA